MQQEGWKFHPITEKVTTENKGLAKGRLTKEVVKGEIVLCGPEFEDCAALMDALWHPDWNVCPCGCDVPMDDDDYARLHGDSVSQQ